MSAEIRLAKDLALPLEVVTQTIGVLAKRRAGKSYTARRLVEQLVHAGLQVVILDPKGDWWGVRSSRDGKRAGLPITILGGERGDAPLEAGSGELVAHLVVEERVSVLLDLSLFRKHEVATFAAAFLETLYRLKAREQHRTPVQVVIDEADAIAPQKPQPNEARMLGAAEDLVRRGGQRGVGVTLISQRSAVLNKNVLTQLQVLVALRTIAPQDRAAIDAWVDVHGTEEEREALMGSIASLPVGEAWVWSPGWPTEKGIFQRVKISPIETFDSGETPKPGQERRAPKVLADVDLEALRRRMAEQIARAKADDPRELRRRIAELERELASARTHGADPGELERARAQGEEAGRRAGSAALAAAVSSAEAGRRRAAAELDQVLEHVKRAGDALREPIDVPEQLIGHPIREVDENFPTPTRFGRLGQAPAPRPRGAARLPLESVSIQEIARARGAAVSARSGSGRMLAVLAEAHPSGLHEGQWAALAGLRRSGGTWGTYKSRLRQAGLLEERGALYFATAAGVAAAGVLPAKPQSVQDVVDLWTRKKGMRPVMRLVLEVLACPEISREDLAAACGLAGAGGTFGTYLSRARTAGLIADGAAGLIPGSAFEGLR